MPKTSSANAATQAAQDLTHALENLAPAAPFATLGTEQLNNFRQLADIFQMSTSQSRNASPAAPRVAPNNVQPLRVPLAPVIPRLLRVPIAPAISPRVTLTPGPSRRVPFTALPVNRFGPHLIQPKPDNPVLHRHQLRSSVNHVAHPQANAVADEVTG